MVFESPRLQAADYIGVRMATLSPDGRRLLVMAPMAGAHIYDVSGTAPPASVSALRERVCGGQGAAEAAELASGMKSSFLRITAADVTIAPIFRGRMGENVCVWERQWYDVALDTLFGWAK